MKLFEKIIGYCPHCKRYFKYPKKRRINTCYEEEDNFTYECKECYDRTIEYFQNMWDEYNNERH